MSVKFLAGVKVLDFTALLPGPFGTVILADMGADVVKVEPPTGDDGRNYPTEMFNTANRNKRGIVLDLKNPLSAPVVERLVQWADIVAEGFRPGVAARLGIGSDRLRAIKPSIVYVSLSGYGQTGPWRDWPGHDFNYLAGSGALSFLGHWNDKQPHRMGLPVADLAGSSYLAISTLAALVHARATGEGATIDVSLAEAAMSYMSVRLGIDATKTDRSHLHPTNDTFVASDGRIVALGVVEDHFWKAVTVAAGDQRLADPRFDTEPARREHGDEVSALLKEIIARKPASEWLKLFVASGAPAQLVMTPYEASVSEQAQARGLIQSRNGKRHLPFPAYVDGQPLGALDKLAPGLGEDNEAVLREIGFSENEIATLAANAVTKPRIGLKNRPPSH